MFGQVTSLVFISENSRSNFSFNLNVLAAHILCIVPLLIQFNKNSSISISMLSIQDDTNSYNSQSSSFFSAISLLHPDNIFKIHFNAYSRVQYWSVISMFWGPINKNTYSKTYETIWV